MTTQTKTPPAVAATITLATPDVGPTASDKLTLTFADGRVLALSLIELSPTIIAQATMHGLKQKLVDAAAISRNPDTGRAASLDDKYDAVAEVFHRLIAGEWNKRREGTATGGLLLRALCRLYPARTHEQILTYLAGKSEAEKAALRRNPKVAAIIDDIRAEDGRDGGIDSDDLLAGLED